MSRLRLREAKPADVHALAVLHVTTWRETYAGRLPGALLDKLTVAEREAMWREIVGAPGTHHLLLEADDQLVGFASAGPVRRGMDAGCDVQLYALYLRAHRQGQGHGRALLEAMCDRLRDAGHCTLGLWVLHGNPARAFYEHCGARFFGDKHEDILGSPVHHEGLRLPLREPPAEPSR